MFCRNGFTMHNSWTRQKLFVALLLISGILIYVFLIYQQTQRVDERFDLFISSAYYVDQGLLVRMIGTGSSSLQKQAPLLCKNEHKEEVKAKIEQMGGPLQCKFWIFYVDCNFTTQSNEVTLFGATNSEMKIPVQPELTERYPLVVCYSRMFYYENWQIALLSIELYRHYGVQMFSIPIISVIEPLYRILKHYEAHKIVQLRNGVVLPKIGEMDPNVETEYFNQVISNTECLYEYRNAADFIAFVDFDDLIIPRNFPTLFEEVQSLATFEPLASSFEFRWTRFNVEPSPKPSKFDIEKIVSNAYFVQSGDVGKSIARPTRIRIGLMHRPYVSREIDGNYTHKILTANDTLTFHLRSQTGDVQGNERREYLQEFDLSGLNTKFHRFITRNLSIYEAFYQLPRKQPLLKAMKECSYEFLKQMIANNLVVCPNPLVCKPKREVKQDCVVLTSSFEHAYIGGGLNLHQATRSELSLSTSCLLS